MSSTDLNGLSDKVQKTEQTLVWLIQNVVRGTWFLRFVFLFVVFVIFASPGLITQASSLLLFQIPAWYGRFYWVATGILLLATLTIGIKTLSRLTPAGTPKVDTLAVRGLLPFNLEDNELFMQLERSGVLQQVLASLLDPGFRLGILAGPSGTGKTSFLRAGLLAQLRKSSIPACYVELSNEDPLTSVQRELSRQGQSTPKGVLLIDQFEQFFLHQRTEEARRPLIAALAGWYKRDSGVRVLISIRAEDLWQMKEIQESLEYQLTNQNYFRLSKFSSEQAVSVLQVLCRNAGIAFDPAFAPKIVDRELLDPGDSLVSPVNVGILIHVLATTRKALTAETFKAYGGIDGVLEDWLNSQLEAAKLQAQEKAVVHTLAAFCDFERNRRSGALTVEKLATRLAGDLVLAEIDRAIQWLQRPDVRLIVQMDMSKTELPSYQLAHERLIPAIRKAAGKLLNDATRANELLDRRTREWLSNQRSSRFLLPLLEYRRVERQRSYLIWGEARTDKEALLNQSRKRWQSRALLLVSSAAGLLLCYLAWGTNAVQRFYMKKELAHLSKSYPSVRIAHALAVEGDWANAEEVVNKHLGGGDDYEDGFIWIALEMARVGLENKDQKMIARSLELAKSYGPVSPRALALIAVETAKTGLRNDDQGTFQWAEHMLEDQFVDFSVFQMEALGQIIEEAGRIQDKRKAKSLTLQLIDFSEKYHLQPHVNALCRIAVGLANVNEGPRAKGVLEQARQEAEKNMQYGRPGEELETVASAFAETGDTDKAIDVLQEDIRVFPNQKVTVILQVAKIGALSKEAKVFDQARSMAEIYIDVPSRPFFLRMIAVEKAKAARSNGNKQLAKEAIQEALKVDRYESSMDLWQVASWAEDGASAQKFLEQARVELNRSQGHSIRDYELAEIPVAMGKLALEQKDNQLLEKAVNAVGTEVSSEWQARSLREISEEAEKHGEITTTKRLLERAWEAAGSIRSEEYYEELNLIPADEAALGYLKRAHEMAESARGGALAESLAAAILAESQARRSPSSYWLRVPKSENPVLYYFR